MGSVELRVGTSFRHPYPPHWHEEWLISLITGGAGYFHYRGAAHLVRPDALFVVGPGEVHANYALKEGCSFRSMYVSQAVVLDAVAQTTHRGNWFSGSSPGLVPDFPLFQRFLKIHTLLERSSLKLEREAELLGLLVTIARSCERTSGPLPASGREPVAIKRAQEFLKEHYSENVSLRVLAGVANLSPYHFLRAFRRLTGLPPHCYQLQMRIMRAKELMRKNWPLAQISSATGFADQSHFGRHFRRLTGLAPAAYLRELSKTF